MEIEPAVDAVLAGRVGAWPALAAELHAQVLAICRRRRYAAGSPSMVDVHRELAVRTLERLHAGDHAALRRWAAAAERHPQASFSAWLGTVVAHLFLDHQRASDDFVRRRVDGGRRLVPVASVELDPDAADAGAGDPTTAVELARIARVLLDPAFPDAQRAAISLWLRGEDAAGIAAALGLAGAAEAHKLLHAGRERLRRRFHHEED